MRTRFYVRVLHATRQPQPIRKENVDVTLQIDSGNNITVIFEDYAEGTRQQGCVYSSGYSEGLDNDILAWLSLHLPSLPLFDFDNPQDIPDSVFYYTHNGRDWWEIECLSLEEREHLGTDYIFRMVSSDYMLLGSTLEDYRRELDEINNIMGPLPDTNIFDVEYVDDTVNSPISDLEYLLGLLYNHDEMFLREIAFNCKVVRPEIYHWYMQQAY